MATHSNDWYFTKEQLEGSPSKQCGVEPYKELSYRQQAANFIQDMGQKLKVTQLCINTAIVYMHRFYVFHSFTRFPWNSIAAAALFLAAKVEEQPRKLEHVLRVVNLCKNPHDTSFDTTSERYLAQSQDLIFNENVLLQTLGFDVAIDHPHTHVVRCCHLVRASKDLAQTSYFMASNSLHLTTMCLQYKPTVVACFCIHFVCKWSNWEIPLSNEKKEWFSYVDETVTTELLEQLTKEFLYIYDRCPSRLKEKIMAIGDGLALNHNSSHPSSPFEPDKKFGPFPTSEQIAKDPHGHTRGGHHADGKGIMDRPIRSSHEASSSNQHRDREREYREKKERERLGHHLKPPPNAASTKHPYPSHRHPTHDYPPPQNSDPKLNKHRPPVHHPSNSRVGPRDILQEAAKDIGLRECKEPVNQVRADKRDYLHQRQQDVSQRPEVHRQDVKSVSVTDGVNYSDKKLDPNRPRSSLDPKLQARRREDVKPYKQLESDIKKHLSAAIHDKNSSILHKPVNSTSQKNSREKIKEPLVDTPKAIPNHNQPVTAPVKTEIKSESLTHNGSNSNGTPLNLPIIENDVKPKIEPANNAIAVPTMIKKPSLFSPEQTPPHKKEKTKTPPTSGKKPEVASISLTPTSFDGKRNRTSSTNSEPELRPVMKKIDQVQGFENLMRDACIGLKLHQVPDIITPIADRQEKNAQSSIAKQLKPPDLIPPFKVNTAGPNPNSSAPVVNGIETNPTLISSLLKQTPTVPHLPTVVASAAAAAPEPAVEHHKEHKKNKKEKHKHKDKEKNREEREKKKKHKDRDREKHHKHRHEKREVPPADVPTPIKITISKDKIQSVVAPMDNPLSVGVKIKIPKDRIKTDSIGESSTPAPLSGSLKIKIPKDVINNFNSDVSAAKKRDKSSPLSGPPNKVSRNHSRMSDVKSKSYNKVSKLNNSNMHIVQTSMYNSVPHPPVYPNQNNYFYSYPPPNLQMPLVHPPQMNVPPPPFLYHHQQFYPSGYMYPELYGAPSNAMGADVPPPLPQDPPPNNPPPPPPDS